MSLRALPSTRQEQDALRSILIMLAGIVGYDAYSWLLAIQGRAWQLVVVAGVVAGFGGVALVGLLLARRGRAGLGLGLTVAAFLVTDTVISAVIRGLGPSLAVIAVVLTAAMVLRALSRRGSVFAIGGAIVAAAAILAVDRFSPLPNRLDVPSLQVFTPAIAALLAVVYSVFWLRLLADYSLRGKLILAFLSVALVPLAVLAVLNARTSRVELTATANQALLGAAGQTAQSIDTYLDNTKGIVLVESQQPALLEYLALPADQRAGAEAEAEVASLLSIWLLRDTRARTYLVLDPSGSVLQATSSLDLGQDMSGTDYFKRAMETGQTYVSDIHFRPNAQEGEIFFSVMARDEVQQPLGLLVVRYNARVIQDIVEKTNDLAGPDSFGVVFDDNHMHVAHGTAPETVFKLVGSPEPAQLEALRAAGRIPQLANFEPSTNLPELDAELSNAEDQPFFRATDVATGERVNQVAVARMATRPWSVAFFQPEDVFLAPVAAQNRNTAGLAAIIALVVTGAALLAAQVLSTPITRLTAVAERVAGGDLAVRAEVESRDETGMLASTFNSMTSRLEALVGTLEQRVAERTSQLQAAADISRATASVRNLDELLRLALELIRERFGYYHASIFLVDEAGFAVLREASGPVGAQLKARGHRLAIGSQSLIGWVTTHRQSRVALDVAGDSFHFRNPLLPDTRSELAIPLVSGDRLLGALDVQSREANAFGEGDVQVMQTLADQLSVAIENADLFQKTEASLNELSGLYQRLTSAAWRNLLRDEPREVSVELMPGATVSGTPLTVPLVLRDQVLGSIQVHGRPGTTWSPEEQAALNAVAAQVAAALESAALLEETQRRRLREQLINDITYQMRASLNPASVVQSGMRELGRALGATEVVVKLTPGDTSAAPGPGNGDREG